MCDSYLAYWDELPAGSGYPLFGTVHVICIMAEVVCIVCTIIIYVRENSRIRCFMKRCIATFMIVLEAYKDIVLIVTGHMEVQHLPLQLCGLAIFVETAYAFASGYKGNLRRDRLCVVLGEVMCVVCLPGALSALLFPDWLRYPVFNYMSLHSFIIHGLLVIMPCMIMVAGEFTPDIKRIIIPVLFLAASSVMASVVNALSESNFMFLRWPSSDSPFKKLYVVYGYNTYLAAYALVVIDVIFFMYAAIGMARYISYKKEHTKWTR